MGNRDALNLIHNDKVSKWRNLYNLAVVMFSLLERITKSSTQCCLLLSLLEIDFTYLWLVLLPLY